MLKHGSLFSGIGGFDLAADVMGWENVFNCEIDPFCRTVLKYHFPNARQYKDVRDTDFTIWRGIVDILTGGFPCQPYSTAGKQRGKKDERHLWPEMLRAIREVAPRWIVGENVFGLLNWSGGLVFDQVCTDLENSGYQVQPFIVPACGVNAPHRRDRIWFVAYSDSCSNLRRPGKDEGTSYPERIPERNKIRQSDKSGNIWGFTQNTYCNGRDNKNGQAKPGSRKQRDTFAGSGKRIYIPSGVDTNTGGKGLERNFNSGEQKTSGRTNQIRKELAGYSFGAWRRFPSQSPVCGGNDGFSYHLDGITFPKWCKESISGYGNAVVPAVVIEIFKAIELYENT